MEEIFSGLLTHRIPLVHMEVPKDSQSAATKSGKLHMEVHKVLHLPRNLHIGIHQVLCVKEATQFPKGLGSSQKEEESFSTQASEPAALPSKKKCKF